MVWALFLPCRPRIVGLGPVLWVGTPSAELQPAVASPTAAGGLCPMRAPRGIRGVTTVLVTAPCRAIPALCPLEVSGKWSLISS